jgi:ABC-type sugar transport system substrate-binding protein
MPPPAPYAFFDTDLSTAAPVFTISQNSMRGGALAGKIMHLLIGDSGSVAVTRMSPEGEHIFERIAGFKRYFSVFPDIKVYEYHVEYAKEKKAVARVCNEILSNVPQIKGVFVPTANIHLFAERVRETGRGGDIKFVGFDLVPANINGLHSGDIDFIISQSPELQGEKSVEMLFNVIAFGESVPANHTVQLGIYTKENI